MVAMILVECTHQVMVAITCLVAVMYGLYHFYTETMLTTVFWYLIFSSALQWQVGGSSYSSMYSSRGMGGSGYMGAGGSGSYY